MGSLHYGAVNGEIAFDDRALAHLQVVIVAKLRRHESFQFSWTNSQARGGGRNSIWLSPGSSLLFRYSGNRPILINRSWIDALAASANSGGGLVFTGEVPL
ncbi:ATP-dependent DNA ligase [Lacisediminihabitans sp. H27-G8]|uniref:DUF7882 family protein n=1 Tax=Lacisediminihabitans sp. H27-G8 TaxID=3111909 RepID=UPI0038FD10D4